MEWIRFLNGDRTAGFRMVALVISILFVFTISVTIVNVKRKVTEKATRTYSFKQIINILFKNKQLITYIRLLLTYNLCMQIAVESSYIISNMLQEKKSYSLSLSVCILLRNGRTCCIPKIVKKLSREKCLQWLVHFQSLV